MFCCHHCLRWGASSCGGWSAGWERRIGNRWRDSRGWAICTCGWITGWWNLQTGICRKSSSISQASIIVGAFLVADDFLFVIGTTDACPWHWTRGLYYWDAVDKACSISKALIIVLASEVVAASDWGDNGRARHSTSGKRALLGRTAKKVRICLV